MYQPSEAEPPQRLSTDAKFWCYLTPYLLCALAVWTYLGSWIYIKAPSFLVAIVSFFSAGA